MMNYPQPRTASEALRLANTEAKAQAILNSREYSLRQEHHFATTGLTTYRVDSPNATYLVDHRPNGKHSCTCPDFKKHGDFCKHTMAVSLEEERVGEMIARYEVEEAILAEGEDPIYGCDPFARF
jgi:hypothetical protein